MKEYIVPLSEDEAFYGYRGMTTELARCRNCKHRVKNGTCLRNMKKKADDGFCDEGEIGGTILAKHMAVQKDS